MNGLPGYVLYIDDGNVGALFGLLSKLDIQVFIQCHGHSFFDNTIANLISELVRNDLAGQLIQHYFYQSGKNAVCHIIFYIIAGFVIQTDIFSKMLFDILPIVYSEFPSALL